MNTGANIHYVSFGDSTFINAYHLGCFFSVSPQWAESAKLNFFRARISGYRQPVALFTLL